MDTIDKLGFPSPEQYEQATAFLKSSGYTTDGIRELLGTDKPVLSANVHEAPLWARRAAGEERLPTLIRFFMLGISESREAMAETLQPLGLDPWVAANLVQELPPGRVQSRYLLTPFEDNYVAFDFPHLARQNPDFVMGVANSTLIPANVVIRRQSRRTWDLGTGCGVLALIAAQFSEQVIGTDVNHRALEISRFNARLNNLANVQFESGSLFEPVQSQKFDLIFGNLPYVISPATGSSYRSGGLQGDDFCRAVVEQVGDYLEEGGYCQVNCNWLQRSGENIDDAISRWVTDNGCDALVWHSETEAPDVYAANWIRETGTAESVAQELDAWMQYFDELGVVGVCSGLVQLRKRNIGPHWRVIESAPSRFLGHCGNFIEHRFRIEDYLHKLGDATRVLDETYVVSPHTRICQRFQRVDQEWQADQISIEIVRGTIDRSDIDGQLYHLLRGTDGTRTLRDQFADLATMIKADVQSLIPTGVQLALRLLRRGYIMPAGWDPPQ